VTSKRLVQIRGSQVYSHIKVLEQLQFVEHENLGRLKVYRTTPKFQNYFGITDINAVKSKLVTAATTTGSSTTTRTKASKQPQPQQQHSTTKHIPSSSAAADGGAAGDSSQPQLPEKT
jgi:segregation and condensation protein B